MLLSFRLANFRSFRDEQEFSFVHGSYGAPPPGPEGLLPPWDERVGTVAGIYGANASGKSNVLKALTFMRDAVLDSYQRWTPGTAIPVDQFKLEPSNEPSLFEVIFIVDRVRYQYGFRITRHEVVGEWLYVYPTTRRQIWFERDTSAQETYYFGKHFPGRNRVIADLTRPDALFLSTAITNNHPHVEPLSQWFRTQLVGASPEDQDVRIGSTASLSKSRERWEQVTSLMRFADLGITTTRVRDAEVPQGERDRIRELFSLAASAGVDVDEIIDHSSRVIEFGHVSGESSQLVYLPITDESLGTKAWFSLVGIILEAVGNGDTLIVDELDASLHPHLTSEILKIFREPSSNPHQAQLLFTTHDTTLLGNMLGERELTRDQVWFTEKKPDGASILYPLTDFAPRKEENLERGYLQGRYGAVPFIDKSTLGPLDESRSGDHG